MASIFAVRRCLIGALAAGCILVICQPAHAIVLISDFNSPAAGTFEAFGGGAFSFQNAALSGYVPYVNGGAGVGVGTIGNASRLASYGTGTSVYINGTSPGTGGVLGASSSAGDGKAILLLDGGSAGFTKPGSGEFQFAATLNGSGYATSVSLSDLPSVTELNTSGLNQSLIVGAGDPPRGIVFGGLDGSLSGPATIELAVFKRGTNDFAYFQINSTNFNTIKNENYVPFTGYDNNWATTNPVFISSTGNSADLVGIFNDPGAIVLVVNSNMGAGFNVKLDSLYSNTPEPTSFVIWGVLGVAVASRSLRRRTTTQSTEAGAECGAI